MTSIPWRGGNLQRLAASGIVYAALGSALTTGILIKLAASWFFWLFGALFVAAVWFDAIAAVRVAKAALSTSDTRTSLEALGFQLTLLATIAGLAAAFLPSNRGPVLLLSVALAAGWAVLAMMAGGRDGFATAEPVLGTAQDLFGRLRDLRGGVPRRDPDPVGCPVAIATVVAFGWLAVGTWLTIDVAISSIGHAIFAGPRWLSRRWWQRGPTRLLPTTVVWTCAYVAVAAIMYSGASFARQTLLQ
jgi:hypothetical protein